MLILGKNRLEKIERQDSKITMSGTNQSGQLSERERVAIYQYFQGLHAYFMQVEDKRDRSGNSRAIKARSKLLNLSESQFFELGTDVYDELQRRRNPVENGSFLVPKLTLHVKRNQARQKLANLSTTRFNDLIDDILYEIQRRHYDMEPNFASSPKKSEKSFHKKTSNNNLVKKKSDNSLLQKMSNHSSTNLLNNNGSNNIQTTTVIPKKASMDWSSDEEEPVKTGKSTETSEKAANDSKALPNTPNETLNTSTTKSVRPAQSMASIGGTSIRENENAHPNTSKKSTDDLQTEDTFGYHASTPPAPDGFVKRGLMIKNISNKPSLDSINTNLHKTAAAAPTTPLTAPKSPLPVATPTRFESLANKAMHSPPSIANKVVSPKFATSHAASMSSNKNFQNKEIAEKNKEVALENKETSKVGAQRSTSSLVDSKHQELTTKLESLEKTFNEQKTTLLNLQNMNIEYKKTIDSLTNMNSESKNNIEKLSEQNTQLTQENDELKQSVDELNNKHTQLETAYETSKEKQTLASKTAIADLEKALQQKTAELTNLQSNNQHTKEMSSLSQNLNDLSIENETLKQKIADLEFAHNSLQQEKTQLLQKLKEHSTSGKSAPIVPANKDLEMKALATETETNVDYSHYIQPDGLIPLHLVKDMESKIVTAFKHLQSNSGSLDQPIGEILFEDVALISDCMSKIIAVVEKSTTSTMGSRESAVSTSSNVLLNDFDGNTNINNNVSVDSKNKILKNSSVLLRAAVSHCITNIRYYAIYHKLLPKITVQSALSEILFILCNLLNVVRISDGEANEFGIDEHNNNSNPSLAIKRDISGSVSSSKGNQAMLQKLDILNHTSSNLNDEDVSSPVRPLKITQKLASPLKDQPAGHDNSRSSSFSSSHNGGKPSQQRKPSNTGLFTSMLSSTITTSNSHSGSNLNLSNHKRQTESTEGKRNVKNLMLDLQKPIDAVEQKQDSRKVLSTSEKKMSKEENATHQKSTPLGLSGKPEINYIDEDKLQKSIDPSFSSETLPTAESFSYKSNANGDTDEEFFGEQKPLQNNKSKLINTFRLEDDGIETGVDSGSGNYSGSEYEDDFNKPVQNYSQQQHANANVTDDDDDDDMTYNQLKSKLSANSVNQNLDYAGLNNSIDKITTDSTQAERKPLMGSSENASEEESLTRAPFSPENFNVQSFDIANPDNNLNELLLYLEHQTIDVISTIQSLLSSIKQPSSKTGELRYESFAINKVVGQMVEATKVSMDQTRHMQLKEYGGWVIQSLEDCRRRMNILCTLGSDYSSDGFERKTLEQLETDNSYADKHFKQRLAGIAFDVAKCTKELVKIVEEATLKEEIEILSNS